MMQCCVSGYGNFQEQLFLFQQQEKWYFLMQATGEVLTGVPVFICPEHKNLNSWCNKTLMLGETGWIRTREQQNSQAVSLTQWDGS